MLQPSRHLIRTFQFLFVSLSLLLVSLPTTSEVAAQGNGGRGPIRVLLITKGHAFDRGPFYQMFEALGQAITYTHVEHPAAVAFWDPILAADYDVFVYYDMAGRSYNQTDGVRNFMGGTPGVPAAGSTARDTDIVPSAKAQADLAALLRQGKPMVFFHHSLASWVHTWPEYIEIMGGACDWGRNIMTRGIEHPRSGYHQNTEQTIRNVAPNHPITQGLGASFQIVDESYTCPMFEDSVTPILRTSWRPPTPEAHAQNMNPEWVFSDLFAWVKTAENSPIAYIQGGHDGTAWGNESFRTLMLNTIQWAASPEAATWARANPSTIFGR